MILDERSADTQSFLMRTCSDKTNGWDTVIHKFSRQFAAGHTRITDGKVESVGHRLVSVFVVNNVVTVEDVEVLAFTEDSIPLITMVDDTTAVRISKQDITTGEELAGIVQSWERESIKKYAELGLL